jgi:BirA family biotin operon repressor/biotin-[acetyl-CoA-carboxylase] ligase
MGSFEWCLNQIKLVPFLCQKYLLLFVQNLKIGTPFIELQQVDSTNNYATGLVHAGMAQSGTVVLAHEQVKGRGQRNKQWLTKGTGNITMSTIIEPQLGTEKLFLFSMSVANGVQRFFNNLVADDVTIKWPNDLYWRDRKAGGILIENVFQNGTWRYAIAGTGININQTDFDGVPIKAVSLKQITGETYDILALARQLCLALEESLNELHENEPAVIERYHRFLFKKDESVKLKKGNRIFTALVKGVSNQGELITEHGVEERFQVGEVEWVM